MDTLSRPLLVVTTGACILFTAGLWISCKYFARHGRPPGEAVALRQRATGFMSSIMADRLYRAGLLREEVEYHERRARRSLGGSLGIAVSRERGHDEISGTSTNDDATQLYGETFRETGRFGSHPAHDDYGAEGRS